LRCPKTLVADLSPLRDVTLDTLDISETPVVNLEPLRDMSLTSLRCQGLRLLDLSPLKGQSLKQLDCDFNPWRDTESLKSMKSLQKINDQRAAEFWKKADAARAEFDKWAAAVAKMPPAKQA